MARRRTSTGCPASRGAYVKYIIPILLLGTLVATSRADLMFRLGDDDVIVQLSQPLPSNFIYAMQGGIVDGADATGITGGAYFPFVNEFDDHGYVFLPAIGPDDEVQPPYEFELLASNPARWRANVIGEVDTGYVGVGVVTSAFDVVQEIMSSPQTTLFGLRDVPFDAAGNPWLVTGAWDYETVTLGGPDPIGDSSSPISSPEPASLAILCPLIFARKRK